MNYNNFTINYIESIKNNLNIQIVENNETLCLPDAITVENIIALKTELESIWEISQSAIQLIKDKHDSTIQSGLFGPIDDLDLSLKIGFLQSDRIILIDYLYNRLLSRKKPELIDREHLCFIGNSLVRLLPLAREGRIVIIPNPFIWNPSSKKIIQEVSEKTLITIPLISMLNMLSICKECKLHPYTIAESNDTYESIINEQIDHVDLIGKDGGKYAYEGILCALLSERLLNNVEFSYIKNISIEKYAGIISQHKGFYSEYLSNITAGGSMNADNNIEKIRESFAETVKKGSLHIIDVAKGLSAASGIGAAGITLLGATSVISAPLAVTGAALGLSASLGAILSSKTKDENTIISLFKKLSTQ